MGDSASQTHDRWLTAPVRADAIALACAAVIAAVFGGLPAVLAGAILCFWLPGRSLLRLIFAGERFRSPAAWTLTASIAVTPLPLAVLWRFSNDAMLVLVVLVAFNALLQVLAAWAGAALRGRLSRARSKSEPIEESTSAVPAGVHRKAATLVAGRGPLLIASVVALAVFCAHWLPQAGGRTAVQAAHDYVKHHAVLLSLHVAPLPLRNVFYAGEFSTAYYYYEFHYYIPAALRKLAGGAASIALVFALSSAAIAAAFILMVSDLARRFWSSAAAGTWAALLASLIGGLDAMPVGLQVLQGLAPPIILDSWCPVPWRLHNLATQYIWCPQHMATAATLLLAAGLLTVAPRGVFWLWLAPALGLSIFGGSAYLAMVYFPAAALYVVSRYARAGGLGALRTELPGLLVLAVVGLLVMLPQALGYREMGNRLPGGLTFEWPRFPLAALGRLVEPGPLANWLDAVWLLPVDLGLLAFGALFAARADWRACWRNEGLRLVLLAGGLGTLLIYTVRSSVAPFDYSFRLGPIALQALLAIITGGWLARDWPRLVRQRWLAAIAGVLASVGAAVGLYELPLAATRTLLLKSEHSEEAAALRFLRQETPPDSVVQGHPATRLNLPQLVDRRCAVLDPENSHVRVFYPLEPARFFETYANVLRIFADNPGPAATWKVLHDAGADYVLLGVHERGLDAVAAFGSADYFDLVYEDPVARIYRVRAAASASSQPVR